MFVVLKLKLCVLKHDLYDRTVKLNWPCEFRTPQFKRALELKYLHSAEYGLISWIYLMKQPHKFFSWELWVMF